MSQIDKKAAIAAYKERKTPAGIYAVRCRASGEVWVGASRHLDAQQNSLWFALRLGSGRNPGLQQAWAAHGEGEFSFEALERLGDEDQTSAYLQGATLKKRLAFWRSELSAMLA